MDIDLILESIFNEYKVKAIAQGKERKVVEEHLELVREQVELKIKETTDEFIGHPANESTALNMRLAIIQELNQFLDTEITVDSIELNRDRIDVNMTYRPKVSTSGIVVQGSVTTLAVNPVPNIISQTL